LKTQNFKRPNLSSITSEDWIKPEYDLAIFALGYESRSTCFIDDISSLKNSSFAFGFNHGHEKSFATNLQKFKEKDTCILESLADSDFETHLSRILNSVDDENIKKIFIDISCFTRFRIAAIVNNVFAISEMRSHPLIVDFVYALADFEKPHTGNQPNTVVGPAHPAFAGWSQGSYSSTATVLGLGYEQDQAMGVVEYLQAGEVWAFAPNSPVKEYKPEVSEANELLLSEIPFGHVIDYDVCAPAATIATLESVVRGLSSEHSVVLVPFGPKIFVLCSLVIAAIRKDVAVWRVSQGTKINPQERFSSEIKIGLRLEFSKSDKNPD
jgi:hypothetical protein